LTHGRSTIVDAMLSKSQDELNQSELLTLNLVFRIIGQIREAFDQKNWERAYNKHDNSFRMTIEVDLKSGAKTILPMKFVRKAALFWTRSPKIPYRIWLSIIKDDMSFYPSTVEEAKSLLFDIRKLITLNKNDLTEGDHKLFADIRVKWGKHNYTEPTVVVTKSNVIRVTP
jgi:hypothetical protein